MVKKLSENKNIQMNVSDPDNQIEKLLNYISDISSQGHSFHSIVWNPISILSDIVLDIMNLFYAKIMTEIKVSPRITIDVKDNRAYIIHIRM